MSCLCDQKAFRSWIE